MRFGHRARRGRCDHWDHWEKMIGGVTVALLVATGAVRPAAGQPPELVIEAIDGIETMEATDADESMIRARARIEQFDRMRLLAVMRLVGLDEAGPPIRVILAPARSELARSTPRWIGGFAVASAETLVLFPGRAPSYPHNSLDALLQHEVAHILIGRAAQGRYVPRWFNEGLAMAAERTWALEDTTRLAWEVVWGGRVPVAELDPLFEGDRRATARAYALSSAFVRDLLQTYGPASAGRILSHVARGRTFEAAFYEATGDPLGVAQDAFWMDQRLWERWIPWVTQPFTLWTTVSLLALYTIWIHRRKRAAQRRKWDEEEPEEAFAWNRPGEGPTVH